MVLEDVWVGLKVRCGVEVPPLTFQGHPEILQCTLQFVLPQCEGAHATCVHGFTLS
jgi:hypothetical protein